MPYLTGMLWSGFLPDRFRLRVTGMVFRYVTGLVTMWAAFEVICVPLILRDRPLRRVVVIWMAVSVVLSLAGLIAELLRRAKEDRAIRQTFKKLPDREKAFRTGTEKIWFSVICCVIAGLFAWQAGHHVFLTHIEDDDSRFIVTALEAYEHDQMYRVNPATGERAEASEPFSSDDVKDVCSPWMMYVATVSRVAQLHPAIVAHLVLAVLLTALMYFVFWLLGAALFPDSPLRQAGFALFSALAIQYLGGTTFTAGSFALTRIWQGKAVLAAAGIPFLFAEFQMLYREAGKAFTPETERDGKNGIIALIGVTGLGLCLLSGMGILFGGLLIAGFGVWYLLAYRKWRDAWKIAAALSPSAGFGALYIWLK